MSKYFLIVIFIISLQFNSFSQKAVHVNVNDLKEIIEVSRKRTMLVVDLVAKKSMMDSIQRSRFENHYLSLELRYFTTLKDKNYNIKNLLLKYQGQFKKDRDAYLKSLLTYYQYSLYLALEAEIEKKEIASKKIDIKSKDPEMKGIVEALAWDLLLQQIVFESK